jgi:hypothetical protein
MNLLIKDWVDVSKFYVRQLKVDVQRRDYCAGSEVQFAYSFLDDNDAYLRLPVLRLSTLASLSDSWNLSDSVAPITSFFKSCLITLRTRRDKTTYRPIGQYCIEAFWRTLISDKVRETPYGEYAFPAPADWGTEFLE